MRNAGLDEAQAGIETARRNINNLRYADDATLMAESKEELKRLLMRMKEDSEKTGLKQHLKNEDYGIQSHHFKANRRGKSGSFTDFIFLGSKITVDSDCSHKIKRCLLLGRKAMTNLEGVLKKQRHHFANKGPYSQSYGFSSKEQGLLISCLQSLSTVILEPKKIKSETISIFPHLFAMK